MFSKLSRYRSVPDLVATNTRGQARVGKDLRPIPAVDGRFRHTIAAGDRLDVLAYRYYAEPARWWRIADANPGIASPLALLGDDAVVTTLFPLTLTQNDIAWADLLRVLQDIVGIEDIHLQEDIVLMQGQQAIGGSTVDLLTEWFSRTLLVRHNRLDVSVARIAALLDAAGCSVEAPVELSRVGQSVVIPPNGGAMGSG